MKTILIVDDDERLRSIYVMALVQNGYRVLEADSGITGLAVARQHLPDLILTDIHMPGGDGSTLLHDIRRDPELRSKQVVLMTGRPDLVTPRKGMEDGADDFLFKPVNLQELLRCIRARLNRASINWRVEDQMLAQLRSLVPPQLPHEVFTPLAGIVGLTEILCDGSSTFQPAELRDIHVDIHHSALRLHRTLRNYLLILDLEAVSLETGLRVLTPGEVAASMQAGVKEALRLNSRKDDITVQIEDCTLAVRADDLIRLVEELVDNACKFSRRGSPVTVSLTTDRRMIVTDRGRGMSADEISRIGAFQQFDRGKHEQQGLGLGVVLVQKLARIYGAEFLLSSEPGEGTRVEIAFTAPPSA